MTDSDNSGLAKFDWRQSAITIIVVLTTASVQWGIMSSQITDHARRLDLIEHQLNDRSIGREEYDRRHEDLIRQLEGVRDMQRDLDRRLNTAGK